MDDQPNTPEVVFRSPTRNACSERALVLAAIGITFRIRRDVSDYVLIVANQDVALALAELNTYASENRTEPPPATAVPHLSTGWAGVYGYIAVVLIVDILDDRGALGAQWFEAGKTHAQSIMNGQWWRAVTALSLHVDSAHLIANVVVGAIFGLFAGQLLGSGVAWASILAAGTMGNLLNAVIQSPQHTSVGASTAVFGALGILAAYAWDRRRSAQTRRLARWTPLVGGAVLLCYLGAGGARTDVVAHLTGFCCGAALGLLYSRLGERLPSSARAQSVAGVAAVMVIVVSWALALTEGSRPAG
jgi:membrane associated rhomboid family serine protease